MGINQTSPTFRTFTVKPRLGSANWTVDSATLKVPTLRGHIEVSANHSMTQVKVPCNTIATLCVQHFEADAATASQRVVLLDGQRILNAELDGRHLCVQEVGCGSGGEPRVLSLA
jgi:hypothetical protein